MEFWTIVWAVALGLILYDGLRLLVTGITTFLIEFLVR